MPSTPSAESLARVRAYLENEYHPSLRGVVGVEPVLGTCTVELTHRLELDRVARVAEQQYGYQCERTQNSAGALTRVALRDPAEPRDGLDFVASFPRTTTINLRAGDPVGADGEIVSRDAAVVLPLLCSYLRDRYAMYL